MKTRFFDHKLKAVAARWAGNRKRVLCVTALIAALVFAGAAAASFTFVLKWGSFGTYYDVQFRTPFGVAVSSSGNVYVTDLQNHRIQKFDSNGGFITKWGDFGNRDGEFIFPNYVAVDSSGNVYVADTGNIRIQKFDSNGAFITKWGRYGTGDGEFNAPPGVVVDSSGNVYVSDSGNNRIQKFDSNGSFIAKWGSFGTGDGEFDGPFGVAVDSSGNVYVVDRGNHRIQKFDSNGAFIAKWGSIGTGDGQFTYPRGVAVDASGNVYVTDIFNSRIQKFDSNGSFIAKFGELGSGDGQFSEPNGVAVDASGNVYVADSSNYRIQKFSQSQNTAPAAICRNVTVPAGPNCTADASINNGSFDPDGDAITITQSPAGPYPLGATTVTLTVTDSSNVSSSCTATVTVTATAPVLGAYPPLVTVNAGAGASVTPGAPPSDNGTITNITASAPGFAGTFSVNSTTGVVTINNAGPAGSYTVTVTATNNCGATANTSFTLNVTCPMITLSPGSLPGGTVGVVYSQTITPSGGTAPFTFSVSGLPAGLTTTATTTAVTIAGTPAGAGSFSVTVTATDGYGCGRSQNYTLTVANNSCGITVNPAQLNQPYVSVFYSQALSASPAGAYTFSVSAGALPPGLNLVTAFGVTSIAGIPTTPGTYNFTIKAKKNGTTCEATRGYTVTIPATIAPILECVMRNANGSFTAKFGYDNSTGGAVTIPVGSNNYFAPGNQNRGQTTAFQPGRVSNAFSVNFTANGSNLAVWFLRGPDGILRPVNVTTATLGCP